ncbi:polysaccharide export protein [Novosphingobium flavum]|uniref:polysaccharide biosynthesis/export family protein n=1 Tax=Novosphingobium aerophilum TaxID=2839843 RepID=UPI00163A2611|nr:polysaccharide biosynthesis/export family protein [Novosphingobium aerophilum]MBC2661980.1 polysaccharide export protein [Novosphingobium aerophilum]
MAVALLTGCATLPSSGPTGGQITRSVNDPASQVPFRIVELDSMAALPAASKRPAVFQPDYSPPPTDLIGSGDQLEIAIYEAGVALFGGGTSRMIGAAASGGDSASQVERFPTLRVDDSGYIRLPYAGRIRAAGATTGELAQAIRRAYRGMSQDPQVLVSLRESVNNSVIIGGEVARPGRLVLTTNRETVSDVIALAGGYRGEAKDLTVRIDRQGTFSDFRLSDLLTGETGMRIFPGDKLSLVRAPRTFAVMGAPGRVEQIPFSGPGLSLAEALALAGGANPNVGDPAAVFVFRFERAGDKDEPVVYHLNMMKAGGYFVAQRFMMTDKDVLYIGNARANQPSKLVQIISQLFSPIVSITALNNSLKN